MSSFLFVSKFILSILSDDASFSASPSMYFESYVEKYETSLLMFFGKCPDYFVVAKPYFRFMVYQHFTKVIPLIRNKMNHWLIINGAT